MSKLALNVGKFFIQLGFYLLVWWFLKRWFCHLFGFRFLRSSKKLSRPQWGQRDKEYYDFQKFKYEQKIKFKLEKYRIKCGNQKNKKVADIIKRLPSFIRVIK
jgi:hypothetical protein